MPDGSGRSIWCRCIKVDGAGFDWSRAWEPPLRAGESVNPRIEEQRAAPLWRDFYVPEELEQQNWWFAQEERKRTPRGAGRKTLR